jgi:hypothetical protein
MILQGNDHDAGTQRAISSHAWGLVALALLLLCGVGCAAAGPIQSQVLDAQTGQPVTGAIVLGVWTKRVGLGEHHTELVGVAETEVDVQGRFVLPRPRGRYDEERVTIYKFGYVAWNNLYKFPLLTLLPERQVPPTIQLEPFPVVGSHHQHMMFIDGATSSGLFGNNDDPKFEGALTIERRMR